MDSRTTREPGDLPESKEDLPREKVPAFISGPVLRASGRKVPHVAPSPVFK